MLPGKNQPRSGEIPEKVSRDPPATAPRVPIWDHESFPPVTFDAERQPPALKALPSWHPWAYLRWSDDASGRRNKVPVAPRYSETIVKTFAPRQIRWQKQAQQTHAETLASIASFYAIADRLPAQYPKLSARLGTMFIVRESHGIVGIDIDNCFLPGGGINPATLAVIAKLNSYTEVTPSGNGIRIFLFGRSTWPEKKLSDWLDGMSFEVYTNARNLTVTGNRLDDYPHDLQPRQSQTESVVAEVFAERRSKTAATAASSEAAADEWRRQSAERLAGSAWPNASPSHPTDDDAYILSRAAASSSGAKFSALLSGDVSSYGSRSEADAAFASMLAFWCGPDANRIRRIMLGSGLARPKWEVRPEYLSQTIAFGIANRSEYYDPEAFAERKRIAREADLFAADAATAAFVAGRAAGMSSRELIEARFAAAKAARAAFAAGGNAAAPAGTDGGNTSPADHPADRQADAAAGQPSPKDLGLGFSDIDTANPDAASRADGSEDSPKDKNGQPKNLGSALDTSFSVTTAQGGPKHEDLPPESNRAARVILAGIAKFVHACGRRSRTLLYHRRKKHARMLVVRCKAYHCEGCRKLNCYHWQASMNWHLSREFGANADGDTGGKVNEVHTFSVKRTELATRKRAIRRAGGECFVWKGDAADTVEVLANVFKRRWENNVADHAEHDYQSAKGWLASRLEPYGNDWAPCSSSRGWKKLNDEEKSGEYERIGQVDRSLTDYEVLQICKDNGVVIAEKINKRVSKYSVKRVTQIYTLAFPKEWSDARRRWFFALLTRPGDPGNELCPDDLEGVEEILSQFNSGAAGARRGPPAYAVL